MIATRSLTEEVKGINELVAQNEQRIRTGMQAYALFLKLKRKEATEADKQAFEQVKADLGYGLLLKRFTPNVVDATEEQIKAAAFDTVPQVVHILGV